MTRTTKILCGVAIPVVFTFLFIACGSEGGGDSLIYQGSTDPAVADSTTAATLSQYGLRMFDSARPMVRAFVISPPDGSVPFGALAAGPLMSTYETMVTIPVSSDEIYYGADYGEGGTGSIDLDGTLTLLLGNDISADADTWDVFNVQFHGSLELDGFSVDDGPRLTGTVDVSESDFWYSEDPVFILSAGDIINDPGYPIWNQLEMTFTDITLTYYSFTWAMGEGDWFVNVTMDGTSAILDIDSMTVAYGDTTYKLEDTRASITYSDIEPDIEETEIILSGIRTDCGIFYHPVLGVIYFSGEIYQEDPPDYLVDGFINFFDESDDGDPQFDLLLGYDPSYNEGMGATVYNIFMANEPYMEKGYFINGVFIQDDNAPWLNF